MYLQLFTFRFSDTVVSSNSAPSCCCAKRVRFHCPHCHCTDRLFFIFSQVVLKRFDHRSRRSSHSYLRIKQTCGSVGGRAEVGSLLSRGPVGGVWGPLSPKTFDDAKVRVLGANPHTNTPHVSNHWEYWVRGGGATSQRPLYAFQATFPIQ